jgi:predicted site-specific integrase-resolvase
MTQFANAAGLSVVTVIKEVAPGVNDTGPKLTVLLKEESWGTLVVEHKDRLSRVGFGWFDALLGLQGRRIVVADAAPRRKPICSTTSCRSYTASLLACAGCGRRDAGPMK